MFQALKQSEQKGEVSKIVAEVAILQGAKEDEVKDVLTTFENAERVRIKDKELEVI